MATHFAKFKGIANNPSSNPTKKYMMKMIVREPLLKEKNIHPVIKAKMNQMTQEPKPLAYKLMDLPEDDNSLAQPLGVQQDIPFTVRRILIFKIRRSFQNNLPVYSTYKNGGMRKLTLIKNIEGDVDVSCF